MLMNNIEVDLKRLCYDSGENPTRVMEDKVGKPNQYLRKLYESQQLSKVFIAMTEALGYDCKIVYVPKGGGKVVDYLAENK